MGEIIIACDGCDASYFGNEYETKTKKTKGKELRTVTYIAHCTNCDKPVFDERSYWD